MDHSSETSLCTVASSPQTPLLRFFLRGGAAVHRLSGEDNTVVQSQADFSFKITDYSIFKLTRITYLKRIIKRITRLTRIILL